MKRKVRPRRQRKTTRAQLARKADKLWGMVVRARGACEDCGGTNVLQAAHGFSRRYRGTRWSPINGFCLCRGCHLKYTMRPLEWDDYLRNAWGGWVYDELRRLAQTTAKPDLERIIASLEAELARA